MRITFRAKLRSLVTSSLAPCVSTLLLAGGPGFAQEYAVPNEGSPYRNFAEVQSNHILHLPTGLEVTADQMIDTVAGSRVIYIGETHDNLEAHRVQLEIIQKLLARRPGKIAIGMEMFRKSAQEELDLWHAGQFSDEKFKKIFRENWGGSYKLYQSIFDYIKFNHLPLIGLKSSVETETRLKKDYTQLNFPAMDANDIYHKAYADAIFGGGKDKHGHDANILYKMLVLWEESMAETVADFLRDPARKNWTLVVLAGGFHIQYGYGIPKRAFRRIPHAYSIILPVVGKVPADLKDREMEIQPVSIPLYAADFGWKVEYKVPPKNRIRLGVRIKEDGDKGVMVVSVADGSVAEQMHIVKGDILLSLDGEKISGVEDLVYRLQAKTFGDQVFIKVLRGKGETLLRGTIQEAKTD